MIEERVVEDAAAADRPLRPVAAMELPGVTPAEPQTGPPVFRMVDPKTLLVDHTYQRNLSERSVTLIRRIVGAWDWRRFKPPVVAEGPQGLEVIDGQHTALAAASHPALAQIPVMVVDAAERSARAMAFIGHNRDRLGITPMQLHFAAVAAGDPEAVTVQQVCERAGVIILKSTPGNGLWKPCQTVAVVGIAALVNRRGAMRARQVLQVLAQANCAPISTMQIKGMEALLHDPEFAGQTSAEDLTSAVISLGSEAEREAKVFSAAHKVPIWRAFAVVVFRRARRGRRRAD